MKKNSFILISAFLVLFVASVSAEPSNPLTLTLKDYVARATRSDTEFEQILIDELTLKYQKNIKLPAKDLVLSVKQQYEVFPNQNRGSEDTTVGLSKLFPFSGTEVSIDYEVGASISSADKSSEFAFTLAQPIAENAFGRSTRLLDKIVGIEVDVASHQIIEAYEDYFATIITVYYTWHEDYENLRIGRSSYKENLKLLDNINERERQKVALPIDVNKVKLQVLSKKEKLIELEEKHKRSLNIIKRIIRQTDETAIIPRNPEPMARLQGKFNEIFKDFTENSRTFDILNKLETKTSLEVARDADDLLPSINLIAGYEVNGDKDRITNEDNFLFAGVSMEWPFPDQVQRAEHEVSKILENKQKLSTTNTYYRLYTQLRNLYLQIEREKKLIELAEKRIVLAKSILEDEKENYSFGKVTLNDYIQAVNDLDNNHFNKISHDAQYKKFLVEWLRLRDRLVSKKTLRSQTASNTFYSQNDDSLE